MNIDCTNVGLSKGKQALRQSLYAAVEPSRLYECTIRLPAQTANLPPDREIVGRGSTPQAAQYSAAGNWSIPVSETNTSAAASAGSRAGLWCCLRPVTMSCR